MSTGERLREERERLGLNQVAFAAQGGVQKAAQINYEKDERRPDTEYLAGIAAAGVDVLYVVTGVRAGGVKPSPTLTTDEEQLLQLFRAAPLAVKAAAVGALQGAANATTRSSGTKARSGAHKTDQVFHGDIHGGVAGRDIVNHTKRSS